MVDSSGLAEQLRAKSDPAWETKTRDVDAETFAEARSFNECVAGLVAAAVVTDTHELLCIHHEAYGGWVLPGGRAEPGEDLQDAAAREVHEETGVRATIDQPLLVIEFVTRHDGQSTACSFVLFEASAEDTRTADDPGLSDEPITDVRWMDSIPTDTPDDETVKRTFEVVSERFDWRKEPL